MISSLEQLDWDKMVDGMAIDHASLLSRSCEACIKAKHAHAPFPIEAKHCSETAGERVMSDVWGKTDTRSSEGYFYYIFFTDDAKRFSDIKFMVDKKDAVPWIKDHAMMIEHKFRKFPKWCSREIQSHTHGISVGNAICQGITRILMGLSHRTC